MLDGKGRILAICQASTLFERASGICRDYNCNQNLGRAKYKEIFDKLPYAGLLSGMKQ